MIDNLIVTRNHSNPSISDMTYSPPPLPDYLSRSHTLRVIVGVPTEEEIKAIHNTISAVNSVPNVPALDNSKLSTQLGRYLFTIQIAVYRNTYPLNEYTYTPSVPSHIPISLEPVVGTPSDGERESAHGVLRNLENLANGPLFDSTFSAKLSQHMHVFDMQFARYIQDSNQGFFSQKQANSPALAQTNDNETSTATSSLMSDTANRREADPIEPTSNVPIPPRVTLPVSTSYNSIEASLDGTVSEQALAAYLKSYDINAELVEDETGNLKPDKKEDRRNRLADYLYYAYSH
ncbi:unnamed protein product [Rhizoctonia solani]|uniref:Uncharacterized protein n=1 Tax=Rhizoctonia solani TaxID=456999 RepID=A0A8H3DTU4_9AGAM|nr:unnamed protein product [Rhizoctonia solani]